MKDFEPTCCDPAAFDMMRRLIPKLETPVALIEGAVAIARHANPDVKAEPVKQHLFDMARTLRHRVRGVQPQAMLAHLHELLFVDLGFVGNQEVYHDPNNSYLPSVLETKRGLPITLSLIYKVVGERAGIKIRGLGIPGHFCCGVEIDRGMMIVDPFYSGRVLTPAEAKQRSIEAYGKGKESEWEDEWLTRPVSNRHWLTRMMQNLLSAYNDRGQLYNVAAILELEILLHPEQSHLMRDLGVLLAKDGKTEKSGVWLRRYLSVNPNDPLSDEYRELLEVMGER